MENKLRLFDSLSRQIKLFEPLSDVVKLYTCGITPYDTTHLGHAFTYSCVDVLLRYLKFKGYPVHYTQNVTDIDDDILRKSREVGKGWNELGNEWTRHFIADMKQLNVLPPDDYPRATDVIPQIVESVQKLLNVGVAYQVSGSIYFEVEAWSKFGKLSQLPKDQMLRIANERGNDPADPKKRNPLDFVLWQEKQEGEPAWESPWGLGRPGWHIECSTLSEQFLGKTVDIHAGGFDLIFPHHECEIAQVEPVQPTKPFVRTWMHIAMVHHEGEKMSKSLGNLVMIRDLLKDWTPNAIRTYLANHHYREEWSYDQSQLNKSTEFTNRLLTATEMRGRSGDRLEVIEERDLFVKAMDDDLNFPKALSLLDQIAGKIILAGENGQDVQDAQDDLKRLSGIFGLVFENESPSSEVINGWDRHLKRFL